MVHLCVAVALSERMGASPSADFLLGNLAPDAIHARPDSTRRDKEHVHLIDRDIAPPGLLAVFQDNYGVNGSRPSGFAGGYLVHLLTDRLWWQTTIIPFRNSFPPSLPDREIRRLYYHDTDRIDLELYRRMPWQPQAWASLGTAATAGFPPFLTAGEIYQWRDRVLRWYDDPARDFTIEPVYISLTATLAFIERAAREIAELFLVV